MYKMPFSENSAFNACSGAFADEFPKNIVRLGRIVLKNSIRAKDVFAAKVTLAAIYSLTFAFNRGFYRF